MKKAHNIKYYELVYIIKKLAILYKCASINLNGADEENRTPAPTLARLYSTIKLCPQNKLEGLVGFEPTIGELQSHALPLGYKPISS